VLKPAIILSKVVFPQPEGPGRVNNSLSLISIEIAEITVFSPNLLTALLILILTLILLHLSLFYFGWDGDYRTNLIIAVFFG